ALAEDVRRFLADEPILARPARLWERTAKWARRRPAVAVLLCVSVAAVLALATVGVMYQARLRRANADLETALGDVKSQRDAAEQARKETDKERERAQAHLHKALEAVEQMLIQVGDERLAGHPEFADLRRQLFEQALEFYRGFLRQESDDPAVRRETA